MPTIQNNQSVDLNSFFGGVESKPIINSFGDGVTATNLPDGPISIGIFEEGSFSTLSIAGTWEPVPANGFSQLTLVGDKLTQNDLKFYHLKQDLHVVIKNTKGQTLEDFVAKAQPKSNNLVNKIVNFPGFIKIIKGGAAAGIKLPI